MRLGDSMAHTPESDQLLMLAQESEQFGAAGARELLNNRYAEKSRSRKDWAGLAYCAQSCKNVEWAREAAELYVLAARSGFVVATMDAKLGSLISECARLISTHSTFFEPVLNDLFTDAIAGSLLRRSGIDPFTNGRRPKRRPVIDSLQPSNPARAAIRQARKRLDASSSKRSPSSKASILNIELHKLMVQNSKLSLDNTSLLSEREHLIARIKILEARHDFPKTAHEDGIARPLKNSGLRKPRA